MNTTAPAPAPRHSAFIPVLLVQFAVIGLLSWMFVNASRERAALQAVEQSRTASVAQAKAVQAELERLCIGLLDLAQNDPQVRELVQRFGISRSTPSPSATPAPAPAGK